MVQLTEQFSEVARRKRATTQAYDRARSAERAHLTAVEEALASGLAVFDAIGQAGLAAQKLSEPERRMAAERVIADYRWWFDASQHELRSLLTLEREGRSVARSEEFKAALAEARVYGYESDRILKAAERFDRGEKGIPLEEAMDELRRRSRS